MTSVTRLYMPMPTIFAPLTQTAFSLDEALASVDRGDSPASRLQAAADALHALGFERVIATLRDGAFTATAAVRAGKASDDKKLDPLPGAVWRRRIFAIERFRLGDLYLLDGSDAWVAREFFGSEPSAASDNSKEWLATDLLLGIMRGPEGEVIGIVKMATPRDGYRPDENTRRDISWLIRHTASRIAHDATRIVAQRRGERLQRLQEAGAALARSLDENEIIRELVRQAIRATGADGALLAIPSLDDDQMVTAFRMVRGTERPRPRIPLGSGVIASVARTGRPFRIGDREADRQHQRNERLQLPPSIDDIAGDVEPAVSIVAVPLLVGIRLVGVLGVYSVSRDVFCGEDEEMLATMASQAATAIANARRYAESEGELRQIEALAEVARAVGESLRLGEVLRLILRHSIALLRAEGACIALRDGDYMHIVAAFGAADVLAGVHLPVNSSLLGRAVTTGEHIITNDFQHDPNSSRAVRRLARIERTLVTPLVTARGTVGAIAVINRDAPFTDEDARVLKRLSDQVSVAIVNARLFEEVERATREWKAAFDAIPNGMVVLDEAGFIKRCNARAVELTRYASLQSLLGKSFGLALLGLENEDEALEAFLLEARTGATARATLQNAKRLRLFELTAAPHPDGGCVISFDDVTQLHGLAERHRRVLEVASEAIIITDTDRRVAFANPAAKALFNRTDLIGAATTELIPPEALEQLTQAESAALGGQVQRYEVPVLRVGGEIREVSVSSVPLVEVGKITGTVACLRDITDQRADAAALAESEARFSRLIEAATDAIFTVDLEGRFTSVNNALVEATGRSRESLLGAPCVSVLDPRDQQFALEKLRSTFAGEREKIELRFVNGEGFTHVASLTAAPIMDGNHLMGALGIVRDITDEELDRETLAQQEQLAMMGRVLRGIARELNTPITRLLDAAEMQGYSGALAPADRHALHEIQKEGKRASNIIRHLLTTAVDAGAERTSVRINQLVRDTLDVHGYSLRASNVAVRLDLSVEDPSVRGNAAQMQQVLINILRNAEEMFSRWQGKREIVVQTEVRGDHAMIRIGDSGPGIAPQHLAHVFEPLFTTHVDSRMRGLGLAVAASVIEEHEGSISVESELGQGATLVVALPIVMSSAERRRISR